VLSSRIEGTRATLSEVMEEEADPGAAPVERQSEIREILNYRAAIEAAVRELERRPLSLNLIRRTHRVLMTGVRGSGRAAGEFRRIQNYIGPPGAPIEEATFVPPPPNEVPILLDHLERYMHAEERDPIVQIGLVHARFEVIHPFLDGNGRVGRILIPLFLFARGVLRRPAFYLSAWLEAHHEEYYARLKAVTTERDHAGWVRFFLRAVTEQAEEDADRVRKMIALYERTKAKLVEETRSRYGLAALDALFGQPIFSTPQFIEESGIPSASAARFLGRLEAAEMLRVVRRGRGRRPTVWGFSELMEIVG
jgi:Fic family protein